MHGNSTYMEMDRFLNLSFDEDKVGGYTMGGKPEWRWQLALGLILILQSFVEWSAPGGPWQEESFTKGVVALIGLGFIYVAKFRWQFETTGVIPYLRLYHCEYEKIPNYTAIETFVSLCVVFLLKYLASNDVSIPAPAPLLALLYSSLMFLHTSYAWLVISGPLDDEEE